MDISRHNAMALPWDADRAKAGAEAAKKYFRMARAAVEDDVLPYLKFKGFKHDEYIAIMRHDELGPIIICEPDYTNENFYIDVESAVAVMNESGYLTPEDFENVDENSPEVKLYGKEYERWMGED